jgi:hypothetical protein
VTTLRHRRALREINRRKPCPQQPPVAPVLTLLAAALLAAVLLLIFTK